MDCKKTTKKQHAPENVMLFTIKHRPLGSRVIGYAGNPASGIEFQGPILGNEGSSGPSKSGGWG